MLHYLQGLLAALDLTSLMDAVLRVAAIFLCLTVHETCQIGRASCRERVCLYV